MQNRGKTDWHRAAEEGNFEDFKKMYEKFSSGNRSNFDTVINQRCSNNMTALHYAAKNGHIEIVKFLLEETIGSNVEHSRGGRELPVLPITHAAMNGHAEVVKYLLNRMKDKTKQEKMRKEMLLFAVRGGYLLDSMLAEVEAKDQAEVINKMLNEAAEWGRITVMKALLGKLKDLEKSSNNNSNTETQKAKHSALREAIRHNKLNVVRYLIEEEGTININEKDFNGYTLLHDAANAEVYDAENIVKFLLEKGADPTILNRYGESPLHYAIKNYNTVAILLAHKDVVNLPYTTAENMSPLHKLFADEKWRYKEKFKFKQVVKALLENGADINRKDAKGMTALHYAITSTPEWESDGAKMRMLLDNSNGLDVNIPNNEGLTPLHFAARLGQAESVKLLLEHGADKALDLKTATVEPPLRQAIESCLNELEKKTSRAKKYREIVEVLLKFGADASIVGNDGRSLLEIMQVHYDKYKDDFLVGNDIKKIKKALEEQPKLSKEKETPEKPDNNKPEKTEIKETSSLVGRFFSLFNSANREVNYSASRQYKP
ncbi:hypothetical protein FOG18_00765 [Legionella israelensis]|uniref:ankyrin repeat domain-containing protein n=1 Tax=Legionella israelensis TaxID=454 RepID=UPI00117C033F|nr:ankyrin repeat domain-containing protein [Legionella israelensis]QDP71218.1 hypothetical protein FOG18_00765 [Legionella israelensis]